MAQIAALKRQAQGHQHGHQHAPGAAVLDAIAHAGQCRMACPVGGHTHAGQPHQQLADRSGHAHPHQCACGHPHQHQGLQHAPQAVVAPLHPQAHRPQPRAAARTHRAQQQQAQRHHHPGPPQHGRCAVDRHRHLGQQGQPAVAHIQAHKLALGQVAQAGRAAEGQVQHQQMAGPQPQTGHAPHPGGLASQRGHQQHQCCAQQQRIDRLPHALQAKALLHKRLRPPLPLQHIGQRLAVAHQHRLCAWGGGIHLQTAPGHQQAQRAHPLQPLGLGPVAPGRGQLGLRLGQCPAHAGHHRRVFHPVAPQWHAHPARCGPCISQPRGVGHQPRQWPVLRMAQRIQPVQQRQPLSSGLGLVGLQPAPGHVNLRLQLAAVVLQRLIQHRIGRGLAGKAVQAGGQRPALLRRPPLPPALQTGRRRAQQRHVHHRHGQGQRHRRAVGHIAVYTGIGKAGQHGTALVGHHRPTQSHQQPHQQAQPHRADDGPRHGHRTGVGKVNGFDHDGNGLLAGGYFVN